MASYVRILVLKRTGRSRWVRETAGHVPAQETGDLGHRANMFDVRCVRDQTVRGKSVA
jgi:hypothetical protein